MNNLENIGYNLILDDSGFRVTAQATNAQLKALEAQFASTGQGVKAIEDKINSAGVTFHQWVTTIGALKFALMDLDSVFLSLPKSILETAGEIEKLQVVLKGLSTAADDAGRAADATIGKNFILNLEQNVPFKLQALTDTFVKLKTVGIDPMNGSMETLLNEVAKYGGSSEQLKSASLAIQQMAGKGVVSLQELRMQLSQAIPGAAQLMADAMGMSMGDLTKAISKGTVASEGAIKKMLAAFSLDSMGAGRAQMETWVGTLEKLNTKWDLFKVDVADAGLFAAAKAELNDMMSLFGTSQAKEWARSLSSEFVSMINLFHDGRVALQEYLPQLIELGKVVLTVFSITVVASWLGGMRNALTGIVTAYQEYAANAIAAEGVVAAKKLSVTEQILAADAKRRESIAMESELRQEALAREIANNQRMIVENDKRVAAIDAARQAERAAEIENNAQILASKIALYEELTAREVEATAFVQAEQYKRAQMGLASNAATAAEYAAQAKFTAEVEGRLASMRAEIGLLEAEAIALRERNALLMAATAAEIENAGAMSSSNAALVEKNAALATAIGAERVAIANMAEMTFGTAALKTGLMGLQFAFNAVGGWLTVLAGIIIGGIALWDRYAEASKRAANAALDAANLKRSIAQGDVSKEQLDKSDAHIGDQKSKIAGLENQLWEAENAHSGTNGEYVPADPTRANQLRAQLAAEKSALADLVAQRAEAKKTLDESDAKLQASKYATRYQGDTDAQIEQIAKSGQNQVSAIKKRYDDLMQTMDSQSPAYKAAADKRAKEVQAAIQKGTADIAAAYDARDRELRTKIDNVSGPDASLQKAALEKELARVRQEAQNAQSTMNNALAPNQFLAPKNTGGHVAAPTDFLEKALDHVKVQLAGATEQLRQIQTGATEYDKLRKGVEIQVKEMVDAGQLDYVTHGKNGKRNTPSMDDADVQQLIDDKTALAIVNNAKQQLAQIKQKLAPAEEELKRSLALLQSGDYTTKPGAANERVLNFLDKINVKGFEASRAVASITEEEKKLLLVAPTKDLVDYTRNLMSGYEAQKAQLIQNKKDQLDEEYRIAKQAWEREDAAKLNAVKKLGGDVALEEAAIAQKRAIDEEAWAKKLETPMESLAKKWGDTTAEMQNASTSWASSTIDVFVNAVKTGKVQFGSLLETIATDMLKISLQKSMGTGLQQMFDGLTKGFVGVAGGNGKGETGLAGSAMNAGDQAAASALPAILKAPMEAVGSMFTKLFGTGQQYSTTLEDNVKNLIVGETAQQTTQTSLVTLAQAAQYAAAALASIQGGASGGSGIGGALMSIAGSMAAAYFGGSSSATAGMLSQTSSMGSSSTLMGVQGGTNTLGNWNYTGGQMSNQYAFADGGVMTQFGPLALRKYANGGVADSPQVAVYGEGSMTEAYVPLPDGRSIPVTITGGNSGQPASGTQSNIVVNVINQSGQQVEGKQAGSPRFDGKQMVLDIVLTAATQPGSFRDGLKGALK